MIVALTMQIASVCKSFAASPSRRIVQVFLRRLIGETLALGKRHGPQSRCSCSASAVAHTSHPATLFGSISCAVELVCDPPMTVARNNAWRLDLHGFGHHGVRGGPRSACVVVRSAKLVARRKALPSRASSRPPQAACGTLVAALLGCGSCAAFGVTGGKSLEWFAWMPGGRMNAASNVTRRGRALDGRGPALPGVMAYGPRQRKRRRRLRFWPLRPRRRIEHGEAPRRHQRFLATNEPVAFDEGRSCTRRATAHQFADQRRSGSRRTLARPGSPDFVSRSTMAKRSVLDAGADREARWPHA